MRNGQRVLSGTAVKSPLDIEAVVIDQSLSHSRSSDMDMAVRHIDGTERDRARVCKLLAWPTEATQEARGSIIAKPAELAEALSTCLQMALFQT
jgi:hypothetical protein